MPPEALSWNDADDNNGFHEKLFVMDFDGTLSTELAMIDDKQAFYHDMVTMGLPNGNDGKPIPAQVNAGGGFIPKGASERRGRQGLDEVLDAAKGDERQPEGGLGRWVPANAAGREGRPVLAEEHGPVPDALCQGGRAGPTIPVYEGYTPAWGQLSAEQLWGQAHADVIKNGMTPTAAIDKAFKRAEQIFARYTIG